MEVGGINWTEDKINSGYRPTLYPGESPDKWNIPEEISSDFHRLNSIIESKYDREFLKICAFYNKMFPSLKTSDWSSTSYNVPAFTSIDQERSDTGTGTNYNYLKQIVDQITSRLGTVSFIPMLISEDQSYEFIVYKDEVERILRMFIRNDDFNRNCVEVFHNAAVLGYAHAFIDPYTGRLVKANDYEIGIFESQFNNNSVKQMLYRDYAFPTADIFVYLLGLEEAEAKEVLESVSGKSSVDFKMYFDCILHKVYVTINNKTLPAKDYPFDKVLMVTFCWDTSFNRTMSTSMFDLLYPIQREINRIAAKIQQIVRMYKGAVPVFNTDVDLSIKEITNGAGEALYIDSARSVAELMTVINPTPLDPQLSAQIQEYKSAMYELAGIQNASFDMENMRSAAAVVALDQTRDTVFQAQLQGLSQFIKSALKLYIDFFVQYPDMSTDRHAVDWAAVSKLINQSFINLQPVHVNDPLSDEEQAKQAPIDYNELANMRIVLDIINEKVKFKELPYYIDVHVVEQAVAAMLIKFSALGIEVPISIHNFLIAAYIDGVKNGEIEL